MLVAGAEGSSDHGRPAVAPVTDLIARDGGLAHPASHRRRLSRHPARDVFGGPRARRGPKWQRRRRRRGTGPRAAGRMELHGIAIAPGGSAGLGRLGDVPSCPAARRAARLPRGLRAPRRRRGPAARRPAGRAAPPAPPDAPRRQDRLAGRHDRVLAGPAGRQRLFATRRARARRSSPPPPPRSASLWFLPRRRAIRPAAEVDVHLFDG